MALPSLNGTVYPRQASALKQHLSAHLKAAQPPAIEGKIFGLIVPNTNLLDGAPVAAGIYKLLEGQHYDTVILIAPSHNGRFERMNICQVDVYHTPLGEVAVNDRMRHELCDEDDDIYLDDSGHFNDTGSDVQLPFLQTLLDQFDVVPVVMGDESPEFCRELGHAIGEISYNHNVLVVASADLVAASDEHLAEFKTGFEAGDVSRLMMLFNSERVEMVGKGPLLVAMIAAQHRHVGQGHILFLDPPRADAPGYVGAVLCQ